MAGCNSHETTNMYLNLREVSLNDQKQFRLNNINEIKYYFNAEIKETELMSKTFDYFDKSLIVLPVTTGRISIASFATVIGAPVGMMSAKCSLPFSVATRIIKTIKIARNNAK